MSEEICPISWSAGILSDSQIAYLSQTDTPMISPFIPRQVKDNGIVSYGLSSYGYDVRIADEFKVISKNVLEEGLFDPCPLRIIDPTDLDPSIFVDYKNSEIIIPPHGFVLGKTIEVVNIPRDVMVIALAKSTFARCGLVVGITPIEAGFIGTITIELSNTTYLPIRVKAGHGICQFLFLKGSSPCEVSYADRGGKYQGQIDVTLPKTLS